MSAPVRRLITPDDDDPRHGTVNGYSNLKCRCPDCTEAWTQSFSDFRRKVRELAADDPRHGTVNAYEYWHCRCDRCRTARNRADSNRKRASR